MWWHLSHSSSQLYILTSGLRAVEVCTERLDYEIQQLGNEHRFDSSLSLPAVVVATTSKGEGRIDGTRNVLNYRS